MVFFQYFLKKKYEISPCDSKDEFAEYINDAKYDLVLYDFHAITPDGKDQVISVLKHIPKNHKRLPVIGIANLYKSYRGNDLSHNYDLDGILLRPFTNNVLAALIENLLGE